MMDDEMKKCLHCGVETHPSAMECKNGCKNPFENLFDDLNNMKETLSKDAERLKKKITGEIPIDYTGDKK